MSPILQKAMKSKPLFAAVATVVLLAGSAILFYPLIFIFGEVQTELAASPLQTEIFFLEEAAHDDFANALRNAGSARGFTVRFDGMPAAKKTNLITMRRTDIYLIGVNAPPNEFHLSTYATGPETAAVRESSKATMTELREELLKVKGVSAKQSP